MVFFALIEKPILKFMWTLKGPQIAKIILKKTRIGGLTRPNSKTYHKSTVINTTWYWQKDSHTDDGLDHAAGKGQSFQQMVLGQLESRVQNDYTGPLPSHHIQKSTQNGSRT